MKITVKTGIIFLTGAAVYLLLSFPVHAIDEGQWRAPEAYEEQLSGAGLNTLTDGLPAQTREALEKYSLTPGNINALSSFKINGLIECMAELSSESGRTPLAAFSLCLAILLLSTVTEGLRTGLSEKRLQTVQNGVVTVSLCMCVIAPLCQTVTRTSEIIRGGAGFMLLSFPVLAGLLATSGKEVTAASCYGTMLTAGNALSAAASMLVVPVMNIFLSLSVTSSLSPGLRFNSICDSVYKVAKWILTLVTSVFVTVMSVQTVITSSMDNVSRRTLRFAVGSFVPVVGNVLSEAIASFSGSLALLRSGAGVFIIIAAAFLIIPVLAECVIWQLSLFILSSFSEILGLSQASGLFRSVSKSAGMLTALLLCTLTVFIIGTVVILLAGREG